MFFEPYHSVSNDEFSYNTFENFSFPLHIHRSYEFFMQHEGETEITIDGEPYPLKSGEAVLIFPFQAHSYTLVSEGRNSVCFFSPELVDDFRQATRHLLPISNRCPCVDTENAKKDNIFLQRSFAYSICGAFHTEREYRRLPKETSEGVIVSLLLFAEENYTSSCMLKDAASSIGYDYTYLSKHFKKKTGISFNGYVNLLRINRAKHLLGTTTLSISEIRDRCGFSCLRTFNREFRAVTGHTPSEYKRLILK